MPEWFLTALLTWTALMLTLSLILSILNHRK